MGQPRFEPGHLQNMESYHYTEDMINQQWRHNFNW